MNAVLQPYELLNKLRHSQLSERFSRNASLLIDVTVTMHFRVSGMYFQIQHTDLRPNELKSL